MDNKIYHGFTLVELMVVVVIIGIIAAIAIPNFVKIVDKSREATVKSNMHTVQFVVELYKVDNPLKYPDNATTIINTSDIPRKFKNPFNPSDPALQDKSDNDIEGVVEYDTKDPYNIYTITGIGRNEQSLDLTLIQGEL
ncbi:prepilin-type N-terminal cleavage/methylation domain-containing protein [candidate division WOR-3 bacterium]|nr:prepilin-type N-terminal cleavage/methylation domain-containing protein [candidate division WOR-3 bacterium]